MKSFNLTTFFSSCLATNRVDFSGLQSSIIDSIQSIIYSCLPFASLWEESNSCNACLSTVQVGLPAGQAGCCMHACAMQACCC